MAQFNEVCIVSYARTPMGSLAGSLSSFSAAQLGACAMKAVLSNASVGAEAVEEVFFGHVLTGGAGQHSARQAAEQAGIRAPATGVNKVCASGMKAATLGAQAIMLGLRDCVMVGGMESMSNAPYVASAMRGGALYGAQSRGRALAARFRAGAPAPPCRHHAIDRARVLVAAPRLAPCDQAALVPPPPCLVALRLIRQPARAAMTWLASRYACADLRARATGRGARAVASPCAGNAVQRHLPALRLPRETPRVVAARAVHDQAIDTLRLVRV